MSLQSTTTGIIVWIALLLLLTTNHARAQETCSTEETALESCIVAKSCEHCVDDQEAKPKEAAPSNLEDPTEFAERLKQTLQQQCESFQQTVCYSKACCPQCLAELVTVYECLEAGFQEDIDSALQDLAQQTGNATATSASDEMWIECNLVEVSCEDGAKTSSDGEDDSTDGSNSGASSKDSYGLLAMANLVAIVVTLIKN